jgi:hypothetical protein
MTAKTITYEADPEDFEDEVSQPKALVVAGSQAIAVADPNAGDRLTWISADDFGG